MMAIKIIDPPARCGRPPAAMGKLDSIGIDAICGQIEADMSYSQIAIAIGVSRDTLATWFRADPERTARVRDAVKLSAMTCDAKAEQVLLDLPVDATQAQVAQARELASHYRWRAKARNPAVFGDKHQVELSTDLVIRQLSDQELEAKLASVTARLRVAQLI